jgi:hypothetical protein
MFIGARSFMSFASKQLPCRYVMATFGVFMSAIDVEQIAAQKAGKPPATQAVMPFYKKIEFIDSAAKRLSPSAGNWEFYDGSVYTKKRGYGWLAELSGVSAEGHGGYRVIRQGLYQENQPLVFRIDLPNGWYRVRCASVTNAPLPVVDQRNFSCRAQDSVFAGSRFGPPLKIRGKGLVEGSDIVEVTDKHLRIVVGDPAYEGWTWSFKGPWYRGWSVWWGEWGDHRYAQTWHQKLMRVIDPGFHHLRLKTLEIERITGVPKRHRLFFGDFFSRDDSPDINTGLAEADHWVKVRLDPSVREPIESELYRTAVKFIGPKNGKGLIGVVQKKTSPETGVIRYATRVSLFTGAGSKVRSGFQEAGLLILSETGETSDFNSTFVGIAFDRTRTETPGWVVYRVGNGMNGYRTNVEIPDSLLPFRVTDGEHEIIVEHDVRNKRLSRIQIDGADITSHVPLSDRRQRIERGRFGVRGLMDSLGSGVSLQQFYWYYRVEDISEGISDVSPQNGR